MSRIEEGDCEYKYIPNATTITQKSLHRFPNVEHFLKILLKNIDIEPISVVSRTDESVLAKRLFQYHIDVELNYYQPAYGRFMDCFVQKHLSNQFNIEITDLQTIYVLQNPDNFSLLCEKKNLHDTIKKHYEIYKDTKTKAIEIIKSIKIVAFSRMIYFGESIPKDEYKVNEDNLREVIKYFEELPYKSVSLGPDLDCDYFKATADIIFDNKVILEIKTSKYKLEKIILRKFYQTILYGFGFHKQTGIKLTDFKIYNPLLGLEYSIKLDNIDFELFEKVLKRDVYVYDRLQKILKDEMILVLPLFPIEE